MMVFVVSQDGNPLMPTRPAKARKLLKSGQASVIRKIPFVIKLNFTLKNPVMQPVTVGIDDGAKYAGIAIVANREKKDNHVVFAGTLFVDNNIRDKMDARRELRKTRRYRLRYRKKRFDNRTRKKCFVCGQNAFKGHETCRLHKRTKLGEKTMKSYWLPPSSKARKDAIVRTLTRLARYISINKAIIETGKFDLHKLSRPEISGEEYQQGPRYAKDTVKAALIMEYGRKVETDKGIDYVARCCYCLNEKGPFEVEHIKPKSKLGTDAWHNLTLSCVKCNRKKGNKTPEEAGMKLQIRPKPFFATEVFKYANNLQQGKNYLKKAVNDLGMSVSFTFGQYTSWQRKAFNIPKTHYNDATIVAVTTYDSNNKPQLPANNSPVYSIKPMPAKKRQRFNATCYSPNNKHPKGAGPEQMINFGYTLKKLVEVNKACVLVPDEKGKIKAQAVKVTQGVPQRALLVVQKGDYVKAVRSGKELKGRVTSLMSNGTIKIQPENSKENINVSLKTVSLISKRSRILFSVSHTEN